MTMQKTLLINFALYFVSSNVRKVRTYLLLSILSSTLIDLYYSLLRERKIFSSNPSVKNEINESLESVN